MPESFVPYEDMGYYIVGVQLPPEPPPRRVPKPWCARWRTYALRRPATDKVEFLMGYSFAGMGQNAALAFVTLKDWSMRSPAQASWFEVQAFNQRFASIRDGTVMALDPPPIEGLGNSGGFALRLQDRAGLGREALVAARDELLQKANASPVIAYAMMENLEDAPQLRLDIDRRQGPGPGRGFRCRQRRAVHSLRLGHHQRLPNAGRLQRVVVQADTGAGARPGHPRGSTLPNARGEQVPLASFAAVDWEKGPVQITRTTGYPAFRIAGDASPGYTTGQAMAELERIAAELPQGIGYEWTGLSYQERVASGAGAQAVRAGHHRGLPAAGGAVRELEHSRCR